MFKKVWEDYKVLLRSIPASTVTLFIVSVIMMNLLANKELISLPYLALDCGFVVSWVSFLCQDMICKRFGAKASIKISILALAVNLAVSLVFWLLTLTPGMWGAYYDTGLLEVNDALNATIGGTWYVVLGSSCAMRYAVETPRKVSAVKHRQMEEGEVIYGNTCYGYRVVRGWERENVGELYLQRRAAEVAGAEAAEPQR